MFAMVLLQLFEDVVDLCAGVVVKSGSSKYARGSCFVKNGGDGVDVRVVGEGVFVSGVGSVDRDLGTLKEGWDSGMEYCGFVAEVVLWETYSECHIDFKGYCELNP